MTSVVVYQHLGTRAKTCADGLQAGAERMGYEVTRKGPEQYPGEPEADIAAFYGLRDGLLQIMRDYVDDGKVALQVDLGYWSRTEGGRYDGFHKISVNSHHPTAYFQNIKHPPDRWNHHEIEPRPWFHDGEWFLMAGMSEKAAWVCGLLPEEWERETAAMLQNHSPRGIIYRHKPSWKGNSSIPGTMASTKDRELNDDIDRAYAIVTHHSNVGVDALIRGIPVLTVEGVASALGRKPTPELERYFPADEQRQQFLNDIAYTQWKPSEMASGAAWAHFRDEGLLCV